MRADLPRAVATAKAAPARRSSEFGCTGAGNRADLPYPHTHPCISWEGRSSLPVRHVQGWSDLLTRDPLWLDIKRAEGAMEGINGRRMVTSPAANATAASWRRRLKCASGIERTSSQPSPSAPQQPPVLGVTTVVCRIGNVNGSRTSCRQERPPNSALSSEKGRTRRPARTTRSFLWPIKGADARQRNVGSSGT